jgi:branched-chain amino acid aminotransferase
VPIPRMSKIWMDGELVDWDDARIHVLTPSLHYGWAVFEGMRAYATDRGPAIFQHRAHVERLFASAAVLSLDIPYTPDELMDASRSLCRVNGQDAYYIRPIAYLASGEMGLNPLPSKVRVAIAAWPWGAVLGEEASASGVRASVSSWQRVAANAIPTGAKVAGAYVTASLAKLEAVRAGYDEAILLNEHGRVAEGTGENLFIVKDGVLATPPTSEGVLRGITRDAVLDFAREADIPMTEQPLLRQDLYTADEAFFTGTASEIVPIRSVDGRVVGPPGPVTKQLLEIFRGVVRGREPKYDHMLDYVTAH